MTNLLDKAFAEAAALPEAEQNALAEWLLREMSGHRNWQSTLRAAMTAGERNGQPAGSRRYRRDQGELDPENM